jgi:hypothetical protein
MQWRSDCITAHVFHFLFHRTLSNSWGLFLFRLFLFRLFPVSPTNFLFRLFLFRLFPFSLISCFGYFPIVCSNPHVRSTLPVGNNSAEVSGTGNRTWYGVCEFLGCGEWWVFEYCTLKSEVVNPALFKCCQSQATLKCWIQHFSF